MLRQLINLNTSKMAAEDKADTNSTASCETYDDKEMQIQVEDEESLQQVWTELKLGAYTQATRIEVNFHLTDAYRRLSKLRRLDDVFVALGSLTHLEELVFVNSDILVSSLQKLLKRSNLKRIKFHHCTLIAKTLERATGRLFAGLATQQTMTCLEIVDCKYTDSDTLCRNRVTFEYPMPQFLQQQQSQLQRLVLDECQMDSAGLETLLLRNQLQELEIKPVFQLSSSVARRQQYQTKKRMIRQFLTETIPTCLANNNTSSALTKLVVSVEDYHLEQVYVETMEQWIDLVQYDNSTIQDLRVTHKPLHEAQDDEGFVAEASPEEYAESYLHYNLKSIIQLNQMFQQRLQKLESVKQEEQAQAQPEKQPQQQQQQQQEVVTEIWV